MSRYPEFPASLLKADFPPERLVYHPLADDSILREIRLGVLFVMAFWSVTSLRSFAAMTKGLVDLDLAGRLQFLVVDIDGLPDPPVGDGIFGRLGGNGEAVWVKDGEVVDTSLNFQPELFEGKIRDLLARADR